MASQFEYRTGTLRSGKASIKWPSSTQVEIAVRRVGMHTGKSVLARTGQDVERTPAGMTAGCCG